MILCQTFVSFLLLEILALVSATEFSTRFFVEIVNPTVATDGLIEKIINRGVLKWRAKSSEPMGGIEKFNVVLFECGTLVKSNYGGNQIVCEPIQDVDEQTKVYTTGNFNAVSGLQIFDKHFIEIRGKRVQGTFLQALTVGVNLEEYHTPTFNFAISNPLINKKKVSRLLGPLYDPQDKSTLEALLQLYAVNNVEYFYAKKAQAPVIFEAYTTILHKLITASGYDRQLGSYAVPAASIKIPPSVKSRYQACFSAVRKSLSPSRLWYRSDSMTGKKSFPKIWPFSGSMSPSRFRSHSPSRPFNFKLQSDSEPESITLSPSGKSLPLGDAFIPEAAGFLAFRMFDPCFVRSMTNTDPKFADLYCKIHCQFLSATILVWERTINKECHALKSGKCEKKMCVCAQSPGVGNVNMVACNNALRIHIYKERA